MFSTILRSSYAGIPGSRGFFLLRTQLMESCKLQGLVTGRGRGMESERSGRHTLMASTLVATFFLFTSDCRHIRTFNLGQLWFFSVLCSSTAASIGELCSSACFGVVESHALKSAAVGVSQITDALGARAESLGQICNALIGLQA